MIDRELEHYLARILANQSTMIEILCTIAASGDPATRDELLAIAREQSKLHLEAIKGAKRYGI